MTFELAYAILLVAFGTACVAVGWWMGLGDSKQMARDAHAALKVAQEYQDKAIAAQEKAMAVLRHRGAKP